MAFLGEEEEVEEVECKRLLEILDGISGCTILSNWLNCKLYLVLGSDINVLNEFFSQVSFRFQVYINLNDLTIKLVIFILS